MIDLHAHILPGLDDGATSLDEAVQMAGVAVADGITTMVATPHADEDFDTRRVAIGEHIERLRGALAEAGIPLEVMPGCEAYLAPDIAARVGAGSLPTLNGSRYVLVEWPLLLHPPYADQAFFELRLKGFVPVLAHAERYRIVQADVNILASLIERGALVQVTAGSLLGQFGPERRRTAEALLEHNLAHVLASDAHSPTDRPPLLSAAVARASRLMGEAAARALVEDVPRALVENRSFEAPPPRPYRHRAFWSFWR